MHPTANHHTLPQNRIWFILAILTPLVLSISFSMDIYVPSIPLLLQQFHTSQQALQWTLSIYMFGVGIGQLCLGPVSDAFGRRKVVLLGIVLYLLGTLTCIAAPTITLLIAGRLLQSIGTCAALVVAFAIVRDLYDVKSSAKIYSLLNAATALGPVIAPLLGGFLQVHYATWRASFLFLFIFGLVSLLTTIFYIKETLPKSKRASMQIHELKRRYFTMLRNPVFLRNTFYTTVSMTVLFVFCCISPYLLMSKLKANETIYGLAFASNAITFILANVLSTWISERKTLGLPVTLGIITLICGAFVMLVVNLCAGLSILNFMLPMWIITAGAGLLMGPAIAIALEEFATTAGSASAFINASQFLFAGSIGTLLMMHQATSLIPFATLLLILGVLALFFHYRR